MEPIQPEDLKDFTPARLHVIGTWATATRKSLERLRRETRLGHEIIDAAIDQSVEILLELEALRDVLIEKGVVTQRELDDMKARRKIDRAVSPHKIAQETERHRYLLRRFMSTLESRPQTKRRRRR